MGNLLKKWNGLSLVKRIVIGLLVGILLGLALPKLGVISIFGTLFVGALKAVAPILVLFLVASAIAQHREGQKTNLKTVICLYIIGTVCAGTIAVVMSFIFNLKLALPDASGTDATPPSGIGEVMQTLLNNIVTNPVDALANANFIGILAWAVLLGIALRFAKDSTKDMVQDIADALSKIVRWIIQFAPLGVMGLVYATIADSGLKSLLSYGKIICLLVSCMLLDALVINPLIVFVTTKKNPYPLVLRTLKDSGVTAFFTRSSAANIPVNMELCKSLNLDEDTYSISIPLGATINMGGASITISVLTMAAAHTLGISVTLPEALMLCILSAVAACGTSGVAGGSLLLIPMAASLFGIPGDLAMKVVGVGFIIGVIQDSCETALNSSVDALFTAAADIRAKNKLAASGGTSGSDTPEPGEAA